LILTFFHVLSHLFGDADALAVEPVLASVARDHELVAVRLLADTPQPFRVIFGVLKSSKIFGFHVFQDKFKHYSNRERWFRGASVVEGKLF
jgi:hypothetical protein